MARNEEKAMAMLNRWVRMKKELTAKPKDARPTNLTEIKTVPLCEKWRDDVIEDITKKVSEIQNAALGEYKIRELNDDINKLLQEKVAWETRIRELGGQDYNIVAPMLSDAEGLELPGSTGYKYFGAAKLLPRVREMFQKEVPAAPKISRKMLYKNISTEYYGMLSVVDEAELVMEERKAERQVREESKFKRKKIEKNDEDEKKDTLELEILKELHKEAAFSAKTRTKNAEDEINRTLLEKKKKALLDKYVSQELRKKEKETIELANNIINKE